MAATADRAKDAQQARMAVAYGLGVLMTTGFHNPKKFPKPEQFVQDKTRRVIKSTEEQRAFLSTIARKVG